MRPDPEIADGIKLGGIAIVSALVTAALVIGAGRTLLPQTPADDAPALIEASLP